MGRLVFVFTLSSHTIKLYGVRENAKGYTQSRQERHQLYPLTVRSFPEIIVFVIMFIRCTNQTEFELK